MMNIAIVCFSKYQLMNIINYVNKYDIENNKIDLFIYHKVLTDNELYKLKELHLFTNIILYKDSDNCFILKKILFRIKGIINPLFLIKQLLFNKADIDIISERYDECIFSFQFMLSIAICFMTNKNNIYMIEDGAVSYFSYNIEDRFLTNLFYSVLGHKLTKIKPTKLYVNNRSLVIDEVSTCFDEVLELDLIGEKLFNTFCYLFNCDKDSLDDYKDYKIIYFNQPNDFKIKNYAIIEDSICSILKKYKSSLYRLHPRTKRIISNIDSVDIDKSISMWDLSSKSISNDIILISSFSTALFTPKLLFNKEPYLIFIFCLYDNFFKNKNIINNLYKFIDRFKNSYCDKNKLCIIHDINELNSIIDKYYSYIN